MEFRVNTSAEKVFHYLSDMDAFVSVHPVIYRIDQLEDETYLIHEKLSLGLIPYKFSYTVSIQADAANREVKMLAVIKKLIQLELHFMIQPDGANARVVERISIQSLLPVGPLMKRVFAKQHKKLFANIGSLTS